MGVQGGVSIAALSMNLILPKVRNLGCVVVLMRGDESQSGWLSVGDSGVVVYCSTFWILQKTFYGSKH